eukprot:1720930-Ditylum_brightwellii.AAC.1
MRNIIGRSEGRVGQLGLKLESQRIADFSRKVEDWQKWKNGMQCEFDVSGCGRILSDRDYADRRRNKNRKFFSNVPLANPGKIAYHL